MAMSEHLMQCWKALPKGTQDQERYASGFYVAMTHWEWGADQGPMPGDDATARGYNACLAEAGAL